MCNEAIVEYQTNFSLLFWQYLQSISKIQDSSRKKNAISPLLLYKLQSGLKCIYPSYIHTHTHIYIYIYIDRIFSVALKTLWIQYIYSWDIKIYLIISPLPQRGVSKRQQNYEALCHSFSSIINFLHVNIESSNNDRLELPM